MSHPDPEVLAGLPLGDEVDLHVSDHVAGCSLCREQVEALARAHAAALAGDSLVPPPARVRAQVLAAVAEDVSPSGPAPVVPLAGRERRRRGVPLWGAGLAAAITLAAGVGVGRLTVDDSAPIATPPPTASPSPSATGSVVASADLAPLLGRRAGGEASAVDTDGTLTVRVRARDLGHGTGYHEVWLLNVDGKRMVALGLLPSGEKGDFQVPRKLLDEGYRIVDISIEPDDGNPTHSGVSLVRGELT